MKQLKTILTLWLTTILTIGGLYVNWWSWFSTDGWWYVQNWIDVIWTDWTNYVDQPNSGQPRAIKTVRTAINRVLGILWLIALILCLWWGFQMLIAAGDDAKVKTWTKVLKHAAIWLAVIWLSWILVSFIFWLINENAVTS